MKILYDDVNYIIQSCDLCIVESLIESPCIQCHVESLVKNEIRKGLRQLVKNKIYKDLRQLVKNVIDGDNISGSLGKIISGIQNGTTWMQRVSRTLHAYDLCEKYHT